MKFSVLTFGCRANQSDSFLIEDELRSLGHVPGPAGAAELVVVNTCAVTAAAEQSARQAIRRVARESPCARIAVTGCSATCRPGCLADLPNVVALIPNDRKESLVDELGVPAARPARGRRPALGPGARGRTVYPLRVQTGCDERCSYCVVPSTRGASVSRPLRAVIADVRHLASAGYKEVILTGVHLGAWGRDLSPRLELPNLLHALDELPLDLTFRLSSLEPMDCTPTVRSILAAGKERFAPHLHLPLQHTSDDVLRQMRRPYTFDQCRRLLEDAASLIPGIALGTDLIVGFPGETERDVTHLERALAELPLSYAHVFSYSDRPGTDAASFPGQLSPSEIRRRAERVRRSAEAIRRRFEAQALGSLRPALTLADGTVALTDNYLKVRLAPGRRRNERVRVRVVSSRPLIGEVVG